MQLDPYMGTRFLIEEEQIYNCVCHFRTISFISYFMNNHCLSNLQSLLSTLSLLLYYCIDWDQKWQMARLYIKYIQLHFYLLLILVVENCFVQLDPSLFPPIYV